MSETIFVQQPKKKPVQPRYMTLEAYFWAAEKTVQIVEVDTKNETSLTLRLGINKSKGIDTKSYLSKPTKILILPSKSLFLIQLLSFW